MIFDHMGLLDTVSEVVRNAGPDQNTTQEPRSEGAYWCDECTVRIRDVDVDGEEPPQCPECGGEMRFERRTDSGGCAC